jgi:hypothetical protein
MNDEKHLRELIQAVLDDKPLQINTTNGSWNDCFKFHFKEFVMNIISQGAEIYRIKPEVKTFTYQTRVYMGNETIHVWISTHPLDEKELQETYKNSHFKWLTPAQTHTIEYTE